MSEFRAQRSNYKLIKYTYGWDVYSFKTSTGVIMYPMYDLMSIVSVVLEKIFSISIRKLAFVLIPFFFGFVHINHVVLIYASLVFVFVHILNKSDTSLNLEKLTSLKAR